MVAGATGSSGGQGELTMPRFGLKSSEKEHHIFIWWCAWYHNTLPAFLCRCSVENFLLGATWLPSQARRSTERCCAWFCAPTGSRRASGWEDSDTWRCVCVIHLPLHYFTISVFAARVSDSSFFQTRRFIWLDGSSWIYAAWLPGKPRPTSAVDKCVELSGRSQATPLSFYF